MENNRGDRMNIQSVLDRATRAQWEVFIQQSRRVDLQLRQSRTEASIQQENVGYGVRLIIPRSEGAGVGFASCNSVRELEATAQKSHELAKMNRTPFFELPVKKRLPPVQIVDRRILTNPEAAARDYAETVQGMVSDSKEAEMTFGKVRAYVVETQILNSRGLSSTSKGTYIYLEMALKIGTGSNATEFWPTRYARRIADLEPTKIVPEWLDIAKSCVRRHPPRTKETTVVLSPTIACDILLPTIGFHASGEALHQDLSQFKEGAKVASEQLSVVDDGLYPYGLRTSSFDDEGEPQGRTRIIERGIFRNHIQDQLHAQVLGVKPTGNGIRPKGFADVDERYQVSPANITTNLTLKPGHDSLDALIEDVKEGIIIHQAAWLNPDEITTRFGSEIRNAQEIVDGELGEAIVGGTISGSALDMIHRISGLSDRPEVISGSAFGCVAPYVRVDRMQISGPS